jgi:hypothetical protein
MSKPASLAMFVVKRSSDSSDDQDAQIRAHNNILVSLAIVVPVLIIALSCIYSNCRGGKRREGDSESMGLENGTKTGSAANVDVNTAGAGHSGEQGGANEFRGGDLILEMPPPSYEAACGSERVRDIEESSSAARS